ncbi:MAG TPA: hypothetical protein VJS92_00535 [Candidatus Polarisedimenticolaceae bacterium]|nr:hypothetical protein [Candidatus Polarisedimenticolaceae bacterium]
MKVLFVCSGNICRSPMAAELLRQRAARAGLGHVMVESAGTLGIRGAPASAEAGAALGEIGLDLSRHRSRAVEPRDLRTADLVIGMAREHLEWLAEHFPGGPGQRELIRAFERGPRPDPHAPDLDDPMGQPIEFYREQLETLERCIAGLIAHLRHGS